jgi:hypothetical protein
MSSKSLIACECGQIVGKQGLKSHQKSRDCLLRRGKDYSEIETIYIPTMIAQWVNWYIKNLFDFRPKHLPLTFVLWCLVPVLGTLVTRFWEIVTNTSQILASPVRMLGISRFFAN